MRVLAIGKQEYRSDLYIPVLNYQTQSFFIRKTVYSSDSGELGSGV
ncbi:hypothetical protein Xbed_02389 [Xenorhabdus beddingii]|uniref:Uncharacterized protein n=1 Tax=Xenorhabdus beddingii TaxID=40578 RepID=A0A1Y2SMK6_9GAMM|nr:hypothetical protein Xbed_02389 [Xenorhabdus beddingii]